MTAVVTAAASVAAIAVVLAAIGWSGNDGSGGTPAAGGTAFADVLGYQWRVTGLVDSQGELAVTSPQGAMIGYTHHGYVVGNDSLNSLGGHYTADATGYTVTDAASTLVGLAGGDPDRKRLISAVDAMFFVYTDSADRPAPDVHVVVTLDGDVLTLANGGTSLTLARDGEQSELSDMASAATSTSTP
jgi:hypothetical protein